MENNKLPDNPNAFPVIEANGSYGQLGMDLRDYFAAKALNGLICNYGLKYEHENYAKKAYEFADDMLIEREKYHVELQKRRDANSQLIF